MLWPTGTSGTMDGDLVNAPSATAGRLTCEDTLLIEVAAGIEPAYRALQALA